MTSASTPSELEELGYDYVAWRTKRGWSAAHVVVGADTVTPDDCAGYWTACRRVVPEDALEYRRFPSGAVASRALENGEFATIARWLHSGDGGRCQNCERILKREGLL